MIKGSATIQFGSGSVASMAGVDKDSGVGAIFMRSVSPGKMGFDTGRFDDKDGEETLANPEVVIYFTNIESLDLQIESLKMLREQMLEVKEGENE